VRIPKPAIFDNPEPDQPAWIQKFDDTGHTPYSRIPYDELVLRFARLVSGIDDNIGRLLQRLESMGRLDDTVVIFTSDNGFLLHEHGLYDKRAVYEESIRVPLLVRYPRLVARGRPVNEMTLNVDLAPTLLELIGQAGGERMQGLSVLKALRGSRGPRRRVFFYQYDRETPYSTPSLMGVRTDDWKLVKYQEEGQGHELYRVSKDPHEATNLFLSSSHSGQRARLERELERLAPLAKVARPLK
jgi:N-acetylglucosamine-6-sulfatase